MIIRRKYKFTSHDRSIHLKSVGTRMAHVSLWWEKLHVVLILVLCVTGPCCFIKQRTVTTICMIHAVGNNYKSTNNNDRRQYNSVLSSSSSPSSSYTTIPPPPPPIAKSSNIDDGDDYNNNFDPISVDNEWDQNYDPSILPPFNDEIIHQPREWDTQQQQQYRRQSQPILDPKKGTSSTTTLPTIHYSFPQINTNTNNTTAIELSKRPDDVKNDKLPKYASARQDVVTQYISQSFLHRFYLTFSSIVVGCCISTFVSQSIFGFIPSTNSMIYISILFAIITWLRNNMYGELIRAISLTLILSLQRSIQIRNQYPAYQYLYGAILGDTMRNGKVRRKPFPPTNNPWTWSNDNDNNDDNDENRIEFQMIPSVIAMAVIGSILGTNVPILPSSLGALLGAITLSYCTTLSSSRGDICRCMGMRCVAFVREFIIIANHDLHLPTKSAIVASAIFDKLLILDRQHSIRHRIGRGITAIIETITRIQRDMQQSTSNSSSNTSSNERPERRPNIPQHQRQRQSKYDMNDNDFDNDRPYQRSREVNDIAPLRRPSRDQRQYNDENEIQEENITTDQTTTSSGKEDSKKGGWFGWNTKR